MRMLELKSAEFKTARFDVFGVKVRRPGRGVQPRVVYMAWFHEIDVPRPACVVTVWFFSSPLFRSPYVEWVETDSAHRRKGIASEVLRGLRMHLDCELAADAASDDGALFLKSFCKTHENIIALG